MYQLYDYQQEIIEKTKGAMAAGHKHICIQSPTGSGKTVMFSHIVSEMKKRGKRALIITDRIELLFETGGTLEEFNLTPAHILAGQMVQPQLTHQVYVAMSQTLRRRIDTWPQFWRSFDVVIMDECHKQEFNPYFQQIAFKNKPFILGFSATPIRILKQRQLHSDYTILIEGPQVPDLIKRGKLVKDHYYGVDGADMEGTKLNSFGDYAENSMYSKFNKPELYAGVVENWRSICPDTITLCFCVNIQHTIETCRAFNKAGIPAKFLVSDVSKPKLPENPNDGQIVRYEEKKAAYENYLQGYADYSGDRKRVLSDWKSGKFKVLINAGILTTGFNFKAIETVIVNRATTSVALWLQMLGRGSRTFPGKEYFNILDFGGNGARLGYYNQERKWSLTHEQSKGGGAMPVKECGDITRPIKDKNGRKGCGAYIFVGAVICPYCGYIFTQEKKQSFAELVKIDYISSPLPNEEDLFDKLEREAENRGYKFGWVLNRIVAAEGEQGLKRYADSRNYKNGWFWGMKKRYQNQIRMYNSKQRESA